LKKIINIIIIIVRGDCMIFIGFRRQIGRVDVRSVVKYTEEKKGRYSEIYLLHTEPLHPAVQELAEKAEFKEIKTTNFKKRNC